ncbi:hypothetical protein [Streptomyces sp. NPDC058297]|uniref:hypothetical protein n=1 Tax=Streptomyces sp. NPDC058297 TaxID=3346433 RepID=UPI0036E253BB
MNVTFTGRAAHAEASAQSGVTVLDAAVLTLNAIGLLRRQATPDTWILWAKTPSAMRRTAPRPGVATAAASWSSPTWAKLLLFPGVRGQDRGQLLEEAGHCQDLRQINGLCRGDHRPHRGGTGQTRRPVPLENTIRGCGLQVC